MNVIFDDQVAAYDRWYFTPLGQLADLVEKEALFDLLPEIAGRLVLDVGCGTGNISLALAHRGAQVVGLDASGPMLARARDKARRAELPLACIRGSAGKLPFAADSFDGVLSILALDFMADRDIAIQEMVRVLRPGGFLAVAMLSRYSLWTLKRAIRAWLKPSLWGKVRFITPKGLRRLLSSHPELTGLKTRQAVYFPPWKNPRLVLYYPYLESWGQKLGLPFGAFLATIAWKRHIRSL
ncbi:MAG: class I SAM-dependent methyltransferase [Deltaproteobacteria bacterium]|nr:class I SAM-dependent methyltransferase [Deltaproteobacteria bacterium]